MARKKSARRVAAGKKVVPRKSAKSASKPKPAAKKPASKQAAGQKHTMQRADYGQPVDGFFAQQPSPQREILKALRQAIDRAAPTAEAALKWGQPFYSLDGAMFCALSSHKAHVNLILVGSPDKFTDSAGRLSGFGKSGRHLRVTTVDELPPPAELRSWLQVSVQAARASKP